MRVFIPDSYFINDAAHRYVTLFSEFGAQGGNYGASSGYEEWGVNSTSAGSGNTATFLLNKTALGGRRNGGQRRRGHQLSYVINDAAHRYVTLFSEFGAQGGNYGASSGYEEWGVNSTSAGSGNTATFLLNKTALVDGGTADSAGEVISYSITFSNAMSALPA